MVSHIRGEGTSNGGLELELNNMYIHFVMFGKFTL